MDYEYFTDESGKPCAEFSMEQALFGQWLTEEVSANLALCDQILDLIERVEVKQSLEQRYEGRYFMLTITSDSVSVSGENIEWVGEEEHEAESYEDPAADCGLQDFKRAILDWKSFIQDA